MNGSPSDDEIAALLALDALLPGEQADAERRIGMLPDLDHLVRSLTDAEWSAPAHAEYGRVRDLLAHLVGVERLVQRWLDPEDTVPDLPDHVAATRSVIAELADSDPHDVASQWYEGARAVAAAAAAGDRSRMVVFHDITISVDQLLVHRTGELWAHAIDICQATGRPLPQLDMERMATLCTELMTAVPLAMAHRPCRWHVHRAPRTAGADLRTASHHRHRRRWPLPSRHPPTAPGTAGRRHRW